MTDKLRNIEIGKNTSLERGNLNSIDLHCDTLLRLHFAGENASLAKMSSILICRSCGRGH